MVEHSLGKGEVGSSILLMGTSTSAIAPAHSQIPTNPVFRLILPAAVTLLLSGCMLFTVADAAVTVVATTVKVGATVVGTTVDVAAAGVKAVAGTDDKKKDKD